jgi:hypothetical protein
MALPLPLLDLVGVPLLLLVQSLQWCLLVVLVFQGLLSSRVLLLGLYLGLVRHLMSPQAVLLLLVLVLIDVLHYALILLSHRYVFPLLSLYFLLFSFVLLAIHLPQVHYR